MIDKITQVPNEKGRLKSFNHHSKPQFAEGVKIRHLRTTKCTGESIGATFSFGSEAVFTTEDSKSVTFGVIHFGELLDSLI